MTRLGVLQWPKGIRDLLGPHGVSNTNGEKHQRVRKIMTQVRGRACDAASSLAALADCVVAVRDSPKRPCRHMLRA